VDGVREGREDRKNKAQKMKKMKKTDKKRDINRREKSNNSSNFKRTL
jgi:hypothetical protein